MIVHLENHLDESGKNIRVSTIHVFCSALIHDNSEYFENQPKVISHVWTHPRRWRTLEDFWWLILINGTVTLFIIADEKSASKKLILKTKLTNIKKLLNWQCQNMNCTRNLDIKDLIPKGDFSRRFKTWFWKRKVEIWQS